MGRRLRSGHCAGHAPTPRWGSRPSRPSAPAPVPRGGPDGTGRRGKDGTAEGAVDEVAQDVLLAVRRVRVSRPAVRGDGDAATAARRGGGADEVAESAPPVPEVAAAGQGREEQSQAASGARGMDTCPEETRAVPSRTRNPKAVAAGAAAPGCPRVTHRDAPDMVLLTTAIHGAPGRLCAERSFRGGRLPASTPAPTGSWQHSARSVTWTSARSRCANESRKGGRVSVPPLSGWNVICCRVSTGTVDTSFAAEMRPRDGRDSNRSSGSAESPVVAGVVIRSARRPRPKSYCMPSRDIRWTSNSLRCFTLSGRRNDTGRSFPVPTDGGICTAKPTVLGPGPYPAASRS